MIRKVGLKIGTTLLALWGVASLIFFLFIVLPGDPAQMMLDQNEDSQQLEVIKAKFGFNLPLTTQYLNYLMIYFLFRYTQKTPRILGFTLKQYMEGLFCLKLSKRF